MRMHKPLSLLGLALVALALLWQRHAATPRPADVQVYSATRASPTAGNRNLPSYLPPQAVETLALIANDGPFPHHQDGVVFGNYESLLPKEPRGYYHEYTVETPGAHNRGARRIITGGTPPVVYYYTDDHYRSFRRFTWQP
ncbi:ribonuclease domain-containing protein [Dyella sp. A6]|uniref:ribonuclease domain-containing protein n=1 Tax=Dyella aluminiiresistens TaxID=3069105 RepID=UPI002E77D02F|nr:ribonuclease domain-containing protein [Dyella sp. A6]